MFDKIAVCYLKQQIYGKLKMNINKNPINFFLQYLHFQNGCYEIFMTLKQCYFYLRGHTHFLGSLGAGLFGAVCAFSEECSFQRRLLLLQFSVDRERHAACLLFVHACCVCSLGAVYACLLCIRACCTYKLIVYAWLLCMCECYVCTITMYAHLLCMHA